MTKRLWLFAVALMPVTSAALAQDQSTGDLAKASQNPVAAMISLGFRNNTGGAAKRVQFTSPIQYLPQIQKARPIWGELHVGSRSIFAAAGFAELSRPTLRQVVMRIDF
jgi:hypothetical protein